MAIPADSNSLTVTAMRDPQEHYKIVMAAGRRMAGVSTGTLPWRIMTIGGSLLILAAALVVDPPGPNKSVPDWFLPLIIVWAVAAVCGRSYWMRRTIHRNVTARYGKPMEIAYRFDEAGITQKSDGFMLSYDWKVVRDVQLRADRIECDLETSIIYVPQRAFPSQEAFTTGYETIRTWWQRARP